MDFVAIYYMTKAFQSLQVKVNFTLAKKRMVISQPLEYNSKVFFMFLNRMQKYKDVVQVDMDELADAIAEDCSHQSLESRGCIAITYLHHLAPECVKDSCKCCLMDVFWYDAYLFICFGHIEL